MQGRWREARMEELLDGTVLHRRAVRDAVLAVTAGLGLIAGMAMGIGLGRAGETEWVACFPLDATLCLSDVRELPPGAGGAGHRLEGKPDIVVPAP